MLQVLSRRQKLIAWLFGLMLYFEMILLPISAGGRPVRHVKLYGGTTQSISLPGGTDKSEIISFDKKAEDRMEAPAKIEKVFNGGPTQPETQSYQSVNANNLVDLFTGDFAYNIPLLDVGGYPVSLHYQSGITMDQEASWVGLGWNINPGAVSRNMRGLPDDFAGEDLVSKTTSMKPNKTIGVTLGFDMELIGFPKKLPNKPGSKDSVWGRATRLGASLGLFYNTYKGYGTEMAFNAGINSGSNASGHLTGSLSLANNSQDGLQVSSSLAYRITKSKVIDNGSISIGSSYNSRVGIQNLQITGEAKRHLNFSKHTRFSYGTGTGVSLTFARPSYTPTITVPMTSTNITFTAKLGAEAWAYHPSGTITGYASNQVIDEPKLEMPAYGYLYYEKAKEDQAVLLDFNREKDVSFQGSTPHIAIPFYTYDTYSITGEGTGGLFRPYRSEIGYVYDHAMKTKSHSDRISVDYGFGAIFHGGIDYNRVYAKTENSPWIADNGVRNIIGFKEKDTTYENVYFKNPGEKTSVNRKYLDMIGDDKLMRVNLYPEPQYSAKHTYTSRNFSMFENGRHTGTKALPSTPVRLERDKRTQVISYLTALEATKAGLDTVIRSYNINSFPSYSCNDNTTELKRFDDSVRKKHHISEISVLNPDGRRYIYGTPVYNISQTEVTMSTNVGDPASGLVSYAPGATNSTSNTSGKEGYFSKEVVPSFAHSFLLSGILSSDYVDLTGDGISNDDPGDAVKFNYTRVYGAADPYQWRAPYDINKAHYNEGLKTDSRDERGSYSYGKKEIWYLNSIESKTMIATFVLETDSARKDAYGVSGENGGQNVAKKLYRLKQINLYARADYLQNGASAKPIKSVNFEYSYQLCRKNPSSLSDSGKLTLKKVWFSYNKNDKGKRNPYEFEYHSSNPSFSSKSMDRWGNYKNPALNPGGTGQQLTNADYPYTFQEGTNAWDSTKAADSISAWTLSEIKLPSGGKIKVKYESDDYAYVQNKRAMQFFNITGFGDSVNATPVGSLYPNRALNSDYHYVFVQVTDTVNSKEDVERKYLEGVEKLFLKLFVQMPNDKTGWGNGYEMIPVYADIVDYGVKPGSGGQVIWIKMGAITGNESAPATTAIQFLRLNLPSKAYPYSEPGDNLDLRAVLGMLGTFGDNLLSTLQGFSNYARNRNWCNYVNISKSFCRLDNPALKKFGGGLRVKRVEIHDNWKAMTGQDSSVYGQEYDYTDTIRVNGMLDTVSSGVASYEPVIGNDENPFRVPHKVYPVQIAALAPTDFMYTEEPFAETLFPAPMVGYGRVRIRTIHKDQKSANGFQDSRFFTAREFPTIVEFTPLDTLSKRSWSPTIPKLLRFDAKNFVTLTQGFKIELNDMHGKMRSQTSYSQNSAIISETINYYRVRNDFAAAKKLSNSVLVADSANGKIDTSGEIGKDVELMVDVREQKSTTFSGSIEANVDVVLPPPTPVSLTSAIPLPSKETNRYRAIAVLKVVNRYAILDSVIHTENGSTVSTKNVLYDGETGEVLLTRTNNEFNDPIYNFNYPAHWTYTGMGLSYKNQGAIFKDVLVKLGVMFYRNGIDSVPVSRYFESGDELLVEANEQRVPDTEDSCASGFYNFTGTSTYNKIWAIRVDRGREGHQGLIFIDKNGQPYSGLIKLAKIVRSGRRNMPAVPVGTITSTKSPVKTISSVLRLHFDSTTGIISAAAARFKDLWRVDSTLYKKDTVMILPTLAKKGTMELRVDDVYKLERRERNSAFYIDSSKPMFLEASSYDLGSGHTHGEFKTWFKFQMNHPDIKPGIVVESATLLLKGHSARKQLNNRYSISQPQASNASYIQRTTGPWIRDYIDNFRSGPFQSLTPQPLYFSKIGPGSVETSTRVTVDSTQRNVESVVPGNPEVGPMVQNMFDDYLSSNKNYAPAMMMELINNTGERGDNLWSRMTFSSGFKRVGIIKRMDCVPEGGEGGCTYPVLKVSYYKTCANGDTPVFASSPVPGFYCYDEPRDTFVCRPNIDTIFNPYRWGVLGNWRLDRAYTYYARRVQSDARAETNTRTDGEIKSFIPYWNFTNGLLNGDADSSRWVWNSEMTLFNSKGYEIENHDPLDRYNSGQYGYNRTLPVAVAQNSKNRNMVFDGFEDYGYTTDTCKLCPAPRFIYLTNSGSRVDSVSHTGQYSLRIPGNTTGSTNVKVVPVGYDTVSPSISIRLDSTVIVRTDVNGKGHGLKVQYKTDVAFFSGCTDSIGLWRTLPQPDNIFFDVRTSRLPGMCAFNYVQVHWTGKIQPKYSEVYKFYAEFDDHAKVFIDNVEILNSFEDDPRESWSDRVASNEVSLVAGQLYDIRVEYTEYGENAKMKLWWASASQTDTIVPKSNLYIPTMTTADSAGSVISDTTWCVRPRAPRPNRVMLDQFSPIQGTKIVVSAWIKEDAACVNGTYANSKLELQFNTGGTVELRPKGPVIEGWQRIEDTLTIPAAATSVNMRLIATSATAVFFDDIRVHPYNSNMKSFVYSPVNIRLLAELDENNYATFYEYDDDGTLIRVKKETERGIKTLRETRSALQKK